MESFLCGSQRPGLLLPQPVAEGLGGGLCCEAGGSAQSPRPWRVPGSLMAPAVVGELSSYSVPLRKGS